jgi:hypothetical protein
MRTFGAPASRWLGMGRHWWIRNLFNGDFGFLCLGVLRFRYFYRVTGHGFELKFF